MVQQVASLTSKCYFIVDIYTLCHVWRRMQCPCIILPSSSDTCRQQHDASTHHSLLGVVIIERMRTLLRYGTDWFATAWFELLRVVEGCMCVPHASRVGGCICVVSRLPLLYQISCEHIAWRSTAATFMQREGCGSALTTCCGHEQQGVH